MRTFRFRIYPSKRQIDMLDSTLNLSRELYNAMLQQRLYAYRSGRRGVRDDLKLSLNAVKVLESRYLIKDEEGNVDKIPGRW